MSDEESEFFLHNESGHCYCSECEKFRNKEHDDDES